MTDKIDPALTPDEWDQKEVWVRHESRQPKRGLWVSFWADGLKLREAGTWTFQIDPADLPKLIAIANTAQRHGAERQFDADDVTSLRKLAATVLESDEPDASNDYGRSKLENYAHAARRIAAIIESYLPPEQ